MKTDASDYGEGPSLTRGGTSRKRVHRRDSMQEAAAAPDGGIPDAKGMDAPTTDASTPFLPDGVSPGGTPALLKGVSLWPKRPWKPR